MIEIKQPEKIERWIEYEHGNGEEKYLISFSPQELIEGKGEFERFDFMVKDWDGVYSAGEKLECTPANKMQFFLWDVEENDAARYWWIYSRAITMTTFIDMGRTLKNLKAPSAGGSTSQKHPANGAANAN